MRCFNDRWNWQYIDFSLIYLDVVFCLLIHSRYLLKYTSHGIKSSFSQHLHDVNR